MKNKLQIRIHNALLSLFNNDLFDAAEKAELAQSVLESQAGLDDMIKGGDLTEQDCERIEADIETFLATTSGRSCEQKIMTCSILMLLFGVDMAAEIKATTKGIKQQTSDSTGETAPPPAEPTPAGLSKAADTIIAKYGDEQVLVVTLPWLRHALGVEADGPLPQGYATAGRNSLDAILEEAHFMPRHLMELDPNCKQLIPYLVVIDQNNQVLSYTRGKAGQATDLHSKLSIGFGGHINPVDGATMDDPSGNSRKLFNPGLTVEMCIMRELKEEIGFVPTPSNHIPKLVGYVNNDADDLGQVHFGLVYIIAVDNEQVDMSKAEDSVLEPRWRNPASVLTGGINHTRLEAWSAMIADPLFGTRSRYRAMDDGATPAQ